MGRLLTSLPDLVVRSLFIGVLAGMRIGEIVALRWKAVDFSRGAILVRATFSEGEFGRPKTKRSKRDLPMSQPVRDALQTQLARCRQSGPDDLVFPTRKQTPLNPRNLLRRVLPCV